MINFKELGGNMQELMEALKNNGAFTILSDIIKQGYAKREKHTERARFNEQRRIALSLLNTIGIDIDDITENKD